MSENTFDKINEIIGEKNFKTLSDVGGLKIGNDQFSIIVPNGAGDGETIVAIVENFDEKLLRFFTSIEGKFNIYKYDCGNEIVETIEGKYGIFHGESFVILVKWN